MNKYFIRIKQHFKRTCAYQSFTNTYCMYELNIYNKQYRISNTGKRPSLGCFRSYRLTEIRIQIDKCLLYIVMTTFRKHIF